MLRLVFDFGGALYGMSFRRLVLMGRPLFLCGFQAFALLVHEQRMCRRLTFLFTVRQVQRPVGVPLLRGKGGEFNTRPAGRINCFLWACVDSPALAGTPSKGGRAKRRQECIPDRGVLDPSVPSYQEEGTKHQKPIRLSFYDDHFMTKTNLLEN